MSETLTHKDLAEMLGVSETTVKSYRRKFPGCFPVASKGKPIRFKAEAAEVARKIRDLFSTGMSVEEVRDRLSEDFTWFAPKESASKAPTRVKGDIPQNFATAVSNMAKSMIGLSQQQSAILEHMQKIEGMLSQLGLDSFKGIDPAAMLETNRARQEADAKMLEEISSIKGDLHNISQVFGNNNNIITEEHNAFMSGMEKLLEALGDNGKAKAPAKPKAQVISFDGRKVSGQAPPQTRPGADGVNPDFPRHILSMPLVVRNDEGAFLSAGGRNIGRISINDLKAILAQTYLPPENFSMHWEHKPDGWWITFAQQGIPAPMEAISIGIQVAEITSSKGVSVLEARKYTYNEVPYHPIELIRFVTGVGK